jgi:antitoxin component of MazEF toxin-antitoxin module
MFMKTIESVQKIIKVGDSIAVTIPAKEAKAYGFKAGQLVKSRHEMLESSLPEIAEQYEKFAKKYDSSLKNLSNR